MEGSIYELHTSAPGADWNYLSLVPKGKRRIILRAYGWHDIAAGAVIGFFVCDNPVPARDVWIQDSRADGYKDAVLAAGLVAQNAQYPLKVPVILSEDQCLGMYCVTGAGNLLNIACAFIEWYYEFERPPWQEKYLIGH